jgi:hypothetical protein
LLHDIVPVVSILVNQELEPEGCGIRQFTILASNPTGHESTNASSRCLVREHSSFPVILKAGILDLVEGRVDAGDFPFRSRIA